MTNERYFVPPIVAVSLRFFVLFHNLRQAVSQVTCGSRGPSGTGKTAPCSAHRRPRRGVNLPVVPPIIFRVCSPCSCRWAEGLRGPLRSSGGRTYWVTSLKTARDAASGALHARPRNYGRAASSLSQVRRSPCEAAQIGGTAFGQFHSAHEESSQSRRSGLCRRLQPVEHCCRSAPLRAASQLDGLNWMGRGWPSRVNRSCSIRSVMPQTTRPCPTSMPGKRSSGRGG